MDLYYPPTWGKTGHKPSDWPGGKLPATLSEAVQMARQAGVSLISSDDGFPIITAQGEGASLPTFENGQQPLTIDITRPAAQAGFFSNPWVIVGGTVAIVGLLSLFFGNNGTHRR